MRNTVETTRNTRHWSTGRQSSQPVTLHMPKHTTTFGIYQTGRQYGGPEEGGWYYEVGHRVGPLVTINPKKKGAFRKLKRLARLWAETDCESEEVWVDHYRGEFYPVERPRYE